MPRVQAAGLVFLLAALCGCASGLGRPVTRVEAVPDADGVQRVTVDMHSFYFEPNRIVVRAGRPVELRVRNRALVVPHELSIDELNVEVEKWGPGSARARFTAPKPGEYTFMCHVDGHMKKGMTGTLVVVP